MRSDLQKTSYVESMTTGYDVKTISIKPFREQLISYCQDLELRKHVLHNLNSVTRVTYDKEEIPYVIITGDIFKFSREETNVT